MPEAVASKLDYRLVDLVMEAPTGAVELDKIHAGQPPHGEKLQMLIDCLRDGIDAYRTSQDTLLDYVFGQSIALALRTQNPNPERVVVLTDKKEILGKLEEILGKLESGAVSKDDAARFRELCFGILTNFTANYEDQLRPY